MHCKEFRSQSPFCLFQFLSVDQFTDVSTARNVVKGVLLFNWSNNRKHVRCLTRLISTIQMEDLLFHSHQKLECSTRIKFD
jgi:hypothetical protein